jgi:hypothetical protein
MALYVYTPDSDNYDSLALASSNAVDRLRSFDGRPLAKGWRPLTVRIVKAQRRSDFPSLVSHVPVFNERALKALRPLLGDTVEALPLKCAEGAFFAINVLDVTDCLDMDRSEMKLYPSGGIMYITRHVFDEGCAEGKHMFKITQGPLHETYVSDAFRQHVERARLTGLTFGPMG